MDIFYLNIFKKMPRDLSPSCSSSATLSVHSIKRRERSCSELLGILESGYEGRSGYPRYFVPGDRKGSCDLEISHPTRLESNESCTMKLHQVTALGKCFDKLIHLKCVGICG